MNSERQREKHRLYMRQYSAARRKPGDWACPRSSKEISAEEKAAIVAEYAAGDGCLGIAKRHGIGHKFVLRWVRAAGVEIRNPRGKPAAIDPGTRCRIIERYRAGETGHAIAKELGINQTTVYEILAAERVQARASGLRTRNVDQAAFDTIAPESAYWIGFLMADGCVTRYAGRLVGLTVSLSVADKHHLLRLAAFLRSEHPIRTIPPRHYDKSFPGSKPQCELRLSAARLAGALARYGVLPAKSHTAKVIGLENDRDFWRGAVDGDGFVSRRTPKKDRPILGLTGSRALLEQFSAFVGRTLGFMPTVQKMHRIFTVMASGPKAVRLADLLYRDAAVSLDRKKLAADSMQGWKPKRIFTGENVWRERDRWVAAFQCGGARRRVGSFVDREDAVVAARSAKLL